MSRSRNAPLDGVTSSKATRSRSATIASTARLLHWDLRRSHSLSGGGKRATLPRSPTLATAP
ncbi:MAG: hypothetical protein WBJ65_03805, partial [Candidatus Microthrix parvicella]